MATNTEKRRVEILTKADQSKASINELSAAARLLYNDLKKLPKGSEDFAKTFDKWKVIDQRLKSANNEIRDLDKGMKMAQQSTESWGSKLKSIALGSMVGQMATNGMSSLWGNFRGYIDKMSGTADQLSKIEKNANMTEAEVRKLNNTLKGMDTRTATADLRDLAIEGGKLGKSGKDLEEYIVQMNQVKVALGEDLGQDAVNQIGKMAGVYDESITKIASGVNEIGAASEASEGYLIDFAFRVGGTSKTLNVAIGDMLGYAAVLDKNGMAVEMAATAFNNTMLSMVKDASLFEKAAGLQAGALRKVIGEKGANEGLLFFIEALKNASNGEADFLERMQQVGIDGARGAQVFLTLSQNIGEVRKQQSIANQAVEEGTSVGKEYEKMNNNLAGSLAKLEKTVAKRLGLEAVGDALKFMAEWTTRNIDLLFALGELLLVAGATWLAYRSGIVLTTLAKKVFNTEVKTSIILQNAQKGAMIASQAVWALLTGNIGRASAAMRLFGTVTKMNPLGLLIGGLTMGVTLWQSFKDETEGSADAIGHVVNNTNKLNATQERAADIMKESAEAARQEFDALRNTLPGTKERSRLITEINGKYGTHLQNLKDEASFLKLVADEEERVVQAMMIKASTMAAEETLTEISKEYLVAKTEHDQALARLDADVKNRKLKFKQDSVYWDAWDDAERKLGEIELRRRKILETIKAQNAEFKKMGITIGDMSGGINMTGGSTGGSGKSTTDAEKQRDKEIRDAKEGVKAVMDVKEAVIKNSYLNQQISKEEFDQKMYLNELEYLEALRLLQVQYGESTAQIDVQIADHKINMMDKVAKHATDTEDEREKEKRKEIQDAKEAIKTKMQVEEAVIKNSYLNREIDKEEYTSRLYKNELEYLEAMRLLQLKYGESTAAIDVQIADHKSTDSDKPASVRAEELGAATVDVYRGIIDLIAMRENAELAADKKILDSRLATLEAQKNAGKISEKDYQDSKLKLEKEYNTKQAEIKRKQFERNRVALIAEAVMNTAVGVTKALTVAPPGGFVLAGLVGAAGALQIANLVAQPVPEFAKGGSTVDVTGQSGRRYNAKRGKPQGYYNTPAYIVGEKGGEYVIPNWLYTHPATMNMMNAIDAAVQSKNVGALGSINSGGDKMMVAAVNKLSTILESGIDSRIMWNNIEFDKNRQRWDDAESLSNF